MSATGAAPSSLQSSVEAATPHVALYFPALSFGGIEKVMLELAAEFLKRGLRVDVVPSNAQGEFRGRVPAGARLFDLKSPHVSLGLLALLRYLRSEHPDVLISAPEHANVVALVARKLARVGTRIIITQHNVFSENYRFAYGLRGRIAIAAAARAYRWADACIAVSRGVAADLGENTNVERELVRTVFNPVAPPRVNGVKPPHSWLRPGEPPVIVAAGRLTAEKGFAFLIPALAQVRKQQPARLMILGEGPERDRLEHLAAQLHLENCVLMPGFVEDPVEYMACASVFVLPSLRESFSMTLVEALSTGVPVVSTDCHGPREILENGKYGLLVPSGNPLALADAILQQLAHGKRQVHAEALRRFSPALVVEGYLEVIAAVRGLRTASNR